MKQADKLILAARIFDAVYQTTLMQEKDNNPEHWKTINGAHVHVDENGNYDGGAGGTFNGNHHYGPGYKPKVEADKKKAKEDVAKQVKAWKDHNLLSKPAEYREGESFKEWKRRDDKYQEERDKADLREGLELDLGEEAYNKLTPEEIVKRVNARYEGTEQCEENEKGYIENPFRRETEQKEEWEKLKNEYERGKKETEKDKQKQAQGNTKYPHGALLKLNHGSGMASLPMEIIPLKDGGDKFVMIASMSGPKIREYPGGIEKFLDDMKEKGHTVSERPPKRDMFEPTGGTTREERRNGRVSRMMRRAALYGRPPGAQ